MRHAELKQRVNAAIDAEAEHLIAVGEDILRHPELGFKETRTAGIVGREFQRLGLSYLEEVAVTGLKTVVSGGATGGPTVGVIGELDSVLVTDHEFADPTTGAAHCCGHNAQITTMLGVANGLVRSGVLAELAGNVALFAMPAEEYVEIDYRRSLRDSGRTEFLGGKSEMVRLGAFDVLFRSMMVHALADPGETIAAINTSCNGFIGKQARFIGKAAHAGGAPDQGINALYAAQIALAAINAQRETFRDDDAVRVHPILTRGGDLVNVIPNDVRFETMVRGKTAEAIEDAALKVDRALRAGAMALGAQVEIDTLPGYMPLLNHRPMVELFRENYLTSHPVAGWEEAGHGAWSTDLGDISHIMPTIEPSIAGFAGVVHGSDWRITDQYLAYILPAKLMAMTIIDLLADGAATAREILAGFTPAMTRDEYLAFMRRNNRQEHFPG